MGNWFGGYTILGCVGKSFCSFFRKACQMTHEKKRVRGVREVNEFDLGTGITLDFEKFY